MSGFYPPNHHVPSHYYNVDPNAQPDLNYPNAPPMMVPDGALPHLVSESPMYHGMPESFVQYDNSPMQQPYMEHYHESSTHDGNGRPRRRSGPGEQVKHRRTRSGCFTCRQRRVKCDEKHPVCERCRKGNRECVYPDIQAKSKSKTGGNKSDASTNHDASSPEDNEDDDPQERLPAIPDNDEEDVDAEAKPNIKREALREASDTPSLTLDRSPSPSETSSTLTHPGGRLSLSRTPSIQTTMSSLPSSKAGLTPDVKFYLDYFRKHMSVHHYALKSDSGDFFKTDFLDMAIKHEPLRYAVVGYAAYFYTLSNPNGRMHSFLQYYNESVSRLRTSITRSKKQGLSTFLTILQLASIEELLGDWVNLMGHQKAAYEILTRLYTPETITTSKVLRKVLLWYGRFDLFVGFQSGGESVLGREWYVALHAYYANTARENPDNLDMQYEERFAYLRLVAKDSNDFFARKAKGQLTDEEFQEQLPKLAECVNHLDETIDPLLLYPGDYVKDMTGKIDPDDIVNPYEPDVIWGGSRWTSNFLVVDMYAIMFMFHIQVALALRKPFPADLLEKAYKVCQVFEAVCAYPKGPPGAIIEAQACLAIATLFLPKDSKTIQWCRRTFVKIEASGYIYSNILRNRMLEQWGLEHSDWWLPNDENCPPIIRSIKNFITDRTTAPKDQTSEDLREMKGIFSTLTISDSPPDDNMGNTPPEGVLGDGRVPSSLDETIVYTGGSPDFEWNYDSRLAGGDKYEQAQFPGR